MRLSPRYDGPPLLRFDVPVGDPSVPLLRQRRRLGDVLGGLDDDQWASPTRCEGWSVRDVVSHLVTTDQYWALSASSGLAGTPTRYLEGFDPVVTPAQLVDGTREVAAAEVLTQYLSAVDGLAACLSGLDEEQWSTISEAPPGLVPVHALARHALWDGWVHERDVLLPLGLVPAEEPDEVVLSLQYVAALGPAFLAVSGDTRHGVLDIRGTDPDARVVIETGETVVVSDGEAPAGAVRLEGRTVELVEALSFRAPLPHDVAEGDRWLLGGLAAVFDRVS